MFHGGFLAARCPVAASPEALRQQPASCQDGERRGRGHGHPCLREIPGEAGAGLRTSSGTSGVLDHLDKGRMWDVEQKLYTSLFFFVF